MPSTAEPEWLRVRNRSGAVGLVPCNFLQRLDASPENSAPSTAPNSAAGVGGLAYDWNSAWGGESAAGGGNVGNAAKGNAGNVGEPVPPSPSASVPAWHTSPVHEPVRPIKFASPASTQARNEPKSPTHSTHSAAHSPTGTVTSIQQIPPLPAPPVAPKPTYLVARVCQFLISSSDFCIIHEMLFWKS